MANGSWRIARTRGGARLPLVIVAAFAIALILIGKAQSSLFDSARAHVMDWMKPLLQATYAPVEGVNRWMGSIGQVFTVYRDNLRLKEENARLRQWHNTALVLNGRIKRYQLLLHAVPDPALSKVVARVIGRANHPFLQTMILDAGKADGVKPGQAVVDARGMIGRIFLTGERTSWVILLTDLNSRIPVTIEPSNAQAIMAGNNSRAPTIEALSQGVELKPGDQVISSGDGDILPTGQPIGVVVAYGKEFRVALFADQSTAQDVVILDFKQPPEKVPAPSPNDLPVTAAGLAPVAPPPTPAPNMPPAVVVPGAGQVIKLNKPAGKPAAATEKDKGTSVPATAPPGSGTDNGDADSGVE